MTNINIDASSLFFVRNLASTNNNIAKTMQRMSTGLRINQAADDAAGLSLSEKITTNINALEGYYRNSQDGLSYLQIAESALETMASDLQRMRELAITAANGIYSDAERTALQDEIEERIKDINQVKDTTSFSKKEIFDKEQHNYSATVVASGTNANITINADTSSIVLRDSSGALIDPADYVITSNAGDGYISISTAGLGNQIDFTVEYSGVGDIKTKTTTEVEVLKGGFLNEVPAGYTAITTAAELQAITSGDLSGNYILMNDIDISSIPNWGGIGDFITGFSGIFDGNGYKVSGLNLDTSITMQGLFRRVDGGTVKNLGVENGNVRGGGSTAILVGSLENGGLVENCYATGSVKGSSSSGGLVGRVSSGSVRNSYFEGTVEATTYVGGVVGDLRTSSSMENCYANATVSGTNGIGAAVGFCSSSTITNSYSIGSATGTDRTGGFAGWVTTGSTVENCYTKASACSDDRAGGFVGNSHDSDFSYVYSAGSVAGPGTNGAFSANHTSSCTETETYANISKSGMTNLTGNTVTNAISGITEEQMKSSSTFSSWDSNTWFLSDFSYPVLLGTPNFTYGEAAYGDLVDVNETKKQVDSTVNTASINTSLLQYEFDQNQDIFNTNITLASNPDKYFVEGVDYKITKDTDLNYLEIINQELLNIDINLEYESAYDSLDEISSYQDATLMLKIDDDFDLGVELNNLNLDFSGKFDIDLTSRANAKVAMSVLDSNLEYINAKRASIGAKMNSLTASMENNKSSQENLTSSRMVIRDADFAKETAVLSQKQIMQQFNVDIYKNMLGTNSNIYLALLQGVR